MEEVTLQLNSATGGVDMVVNRVSTPNQPYKPVGMLQVGRGAGGGGVGEQGRWRRGNGGGKRGRGSRGCAGGQCTKRCSKEQHGMALHGR